MIEDYDDPVDALAELFAEPDPDPDPRFVDRLESRLRVAHAEQNRTPVTVGPRWGRLVGLAAIAVMVLAAATTGLLYRDRSVSSALEMSDASGVSLTLPDGSTVEDPADGFELPDGTLIIIRVGGSAVIDDVVLDEGSVVTVRDGALVTEAEVDLATAPAPRDQAPLPDNDVASPTTAPTVPPDRGQQPGNVPQPTDGRPVAPGPTAKPPPPSEPGRPPGPGLPNDPLGPPVTIEPGPIGPPVSVPPPIPAPPPADSVAPPGVPPAAGQTLPVGLRVNRHGRTHSVKVAWSSGSSSSADWRAVVIRSTSDAPPQWPAAGATVIVGESPAGRPDSAVDAVPPDAMVAKYKVVIVDRAGAVVASSVVQTVNMG